MSVLTSNAFVKAATSASLEESLLTIKTGLVAYVVTALLAVLWLSQVGFSVPNLHTALVIGYIFHCVIEFSSYWKRESLTLSDKVKMSLLQVVFVGIAVIAPVVYFDGAWMTWTFTAMYFIGALTYVGAFISFKKLLGQ